MLPLPELQHQFINAMMNEAQTSLLNSIKQNKLTAGQCLNIYKNNVLITLTQVLKDIYPAIVSLVGEESFMAVAQQYITQYPSTSRNVHDFGDKFPAFLEDYAPARSLPYLPDVARLAWSYHEVFHEEVPCAFELNELSLISAAQYPLLKFSLTPASRLLASRFPLLKIWRLCQEEQAEEVNLDEGGDKLLVVRSTSLEITIEKLTAGEFALLSAFENQVNFETACLLALSAEPVFNIDTALQKHVLSGSIAAFSF